MSMNVKYEHRKTPLTMGKRNTHLACAPHLHRDLELVYMIKGKSIGYADTVRAEINEGDIFLTFPNQIHFYESLGPENYWIYIFSPDLLPEFAETLSMAIPKTPIIANVKQQPEIVRLLSALIENESRIRKEDDPYVHNLGRGYLLSLLSLLIPQMELDQVNLSDSGALRAIVSYCMSNYAENLSLAILEEKLHLNRYYISHLFSKKLHLRFNDYINSLRISEACRYLLNSDSSITEISEQVGFNTQRTFNRAFIKAMGITPGEYRRNNFGSQKVPNTPSKGQMNNEPDQRHQPRPLGRG